MKYLRMFADETGKSHFEYAELNSNQAPFMPPAPPVHVSDGQSVDNLVLCEFQMAGPTMVTLRPESNG